MYAEELCREAGLSQEESYDEVGRQQFLLARVFRLVLDLGLHYYSWSRYLSKEMWREFNLRVGLERNSCFCNP